MTRPLVTLCALLVLLAPAGCKKSPPASAPSAAAQAAPVEAAPAARGAAVLERVPADALAAFVVSSPKEIAEKLGRAEVAEALGVSWAKAAAAITLISGHNLLDPAMWAGFGVSPTGPAGAAWLHARDEVGVFFVTVEDQDKLLAFVKGLMAKAGGQATEEKVGNATLLSSSRERETVLVLASGGAWLVISDRGGEPAMRHARRIAELGKEASLAGSARFGKALDALASGGHATVWVDTRALTAAYRSHLEERRAEPPVDPGDAEAAAREREWKARWEKRSEAEFALFDGLIGGFDAVAIGFDITGAGVRMKAWGGLREGSLLARGLKNGAGVPPVLRSLEARPLFAAAGAVDTAVAMEALALLARADGDELDEGLDEARRELGIDVRADLVGALDGRIGFAITGDLAKIMESGDDPERHFGGSLTLGVSDPAKVKATLDKLWAARGVSRLVTVAGPGERARIAVPRWRDVHVGVVGDVLLATTDPAAFERLGQEGRAGLIDAEAEGPAKDVLRAADPAAVMWYDHGLAALLLSAFRFDWDDGPIPLGEDATDAQKSAHAEYVAARNRANELKKQWQAVEDRAAREVTRRLGILAASARVEEGAVVVRAAQVMGADTLPNAAATIARTVVESQEQLDRLRREMWQAEDSANMLGRRLRDQRAAPEAVLEVPVEPSAAP